MGDMLDGTELLATIRELGLSQGEFADRVGLRQETVSRYIRGRKPIPEMVKLAALGLKLKKQQETAILNGSDA